MNCFPLSKLLEFNDWQNAVTSCPTVPNDLLEREIVYRKHRCSRASTSSKLPEVLMSEFVYGTGENDRFLGTEGVDRYDGAGGDDTILDGDSNDTVRGGEGQDSIHGDGGNDVLYGGVGNDWLV